MKKITILFLILILSTGCSRLLLPYHEHYACEKEYEGGYCGSIKQVYEESLKQDKKEKKEKEQCPCQCPLQ